MRRSVVTWARGIAGGAVALAALVWLGTEALGLAGSELPSASRVDAEPEGGALYAAAACDRERPGLTGQRVAPTQRDYDEAITIRVLDRLDRPLAGVGVAYWRPAASDQDEPRVHTLATDAAGEVRLAEDVRPGAVEARVCALGASSRNLERDSFTPRGGVNVRRLSYARQARIHVVDAETGDALSGARLHLREDVGPRFALREVERGVFEGRLLIPEGGPRAHVPIDVDPPRDYLCWGDRHAMGVATIRGLISAYADRIEHTVPLYPELDFVVEVLDHNGEPVSDADVTVRFASRSIAQPDEPLRPRRGHVRIAGVPFHRGEPVRVDVQQALGEHRHASGYVVARMPESSAVPLRVQVRLDPPVTGLFEGPSNNGTIGLGGGSSGRWGCGPPPKRGSIRVRVMRANGKPAVDALVRGGYKSVRTDAQGYALLSDIVARSQAVSVEQPGLLPIPTRQVNVLPGRVIDVRLVEPAGGALRIEVVDDVGRALPFVRVRSERSLRAIWSGEVAGVQDVSRHTDARGVKRLSHLPAGPGKLELCWGSRRQTLRFEVAEGETTRCRVILTR